MSAGGQQTYPTRADRRTPETNPVFPALNRPDQSHPSRRQEDTMNNLLGSMLALVMAVSLFGVATPVTDSADTHPELHLIPWPKQLQPTRGHLSLTDTSRI